MTDAHCHIFTEGIRSFVCSPTKESAPLFYGTHPWQADTFDEASFVAALESHPSAGVGEIGLDRLKSKEISPAQRAAFSSQLAIAAAYRRPVVLHGAKCWGEVVKACKPYSRHIPAFLFHGFSRSGGLIGDIRALNGFISVGPAVLNDHAVNYRRLISEIPDDMLLVETDATEPPAPSLADIIAAVAAIRSTSPAFIETLTDTNAERFFNRQTVKPSNQT